MIKTTTILTILAMSGCAHTSDVEHVRKATQAYLKCESIARTCLKSKDNTPGKCVSAYYECKEPLDEAQKQAVEEFRKGNK